MTWSEVVGHDDKIVQFRRAVRSGRLASSFLFIGPAGIGKRQFAIRLAQALLCQTHDEMRLEACGVCSACQQVAAESHPDLELVRRPADRSYIPIELFIGDREHRMQEGLCHRIGLKPFCGGRKIAVIDDADFLNQEGANCLLKTLEEPPPGSLIILIGTSEQKQLPTIRSRCQIVRFAALHEQQVTDLLVAKSFIDDPARAAELATLAAGSLERAIELADPSVSEFRQLFLQEINHTDWDALALAKVTGQFVDEAGKDAPSRRRRTLQVIGFATQFYRQLMRSVCGSPVDGDQDLVQAVTIASGSYPGDPEIIAACLDRCLDAQTQVRANANQATLLECWLDELGQIARGTASAHS